MKQGFHGGRKTASLLKGEVNSHLEKFVPEASKQMINVVIHVYANTKGLGRKYKEMGLLPGSGTLEDFIRGFNMGDELCHYTDAGDGKECADVKVQGKSQPEQWRLVSWLHPLTRSSQPCSTFIVTMFIATRYCFAHHVTMVMLVS